MSSTLEASVFMWKNYSEILHTIKNAGNNLTLKLMFDISEKLIVGQSDDIFGVNTINWEDSSWKFLSLVSGEEVISLSHAKVYVFSDSVRLGKMNQNPTSDCAWEENWVGSRVHHNTELCTELWTQKKVSRWNSSGIFSEDPPHCSSATKVHELLLRLSETPENFTGRIIFMSMFNDISWRTQDNEKRMRIKCSARFSLCKKIFTRKMVILRTWIRKGVVFYSW